MRNHYPYSSLFGGNLKNGAPLRYIYVDEAGTSEPEPVTVVVGIIVRPDRDWKLVRSEIKALLSLVPAQYREGFIFHAKSIWGDKRLRKGWPMEDRLALIAKMAQLPLKLGLCIVLGKIRRDMGGQEIIDHWNLGLSLSQFHHIMAFEDCMVQADVFLRERCPPDEIGTVIIEDIPEMRNSLKQAMQLAAVFYHPIDTSTLRRTREERDNNTLYQRPKSGIERIQDGAQFADKASAPLLQIADACAFSFRRFFSNQKYGSELVHAMGLDLELDDWLGPRSSATFSHDPILRYQPDRLDWDYR